MLRSVVSKLRPLNSRPMSSIPEAMLNQLKATNGKPITCKAAVAWKPNTPLDVTDIQVSPYLNPLKRILAFMCRTSKNAAFSVL